MFLDMRFPQYLYFVNFKINVKRIRSYHVCHYRMNTNNHILDVVSNDEPSIKKVEMKTMGKLVKMKFEMFNVVI